MITPALRDKADSMRSAGASLGQINEATGINKSTLSYWYSAKTRETVRQRATAQRAANLAKGLTSKGTTRKPRPTPAPKAAKPRQAPAPRATKARRQRAPEPPQPAAKRPRKPRKPAPKPRRQETIYERHGVLSFARGGQSRHVCRDAFHPKGRTTSGPWRMAIFGHPVTNEHGDKIRLCRKCANAWIAAWDRALGIEVAA